MKENETPVPAHKKWYHGIGFVITLLVVVGPFGLPLLFSSDEFSKKSKVVITVIVIAVTAYATFQTVTIIQLFIEHYRQAFGTTY